ncbi:MAG: hypothetical protein A2X08_08335 [Bacteroidetes bacterium GWA2_32_17]|nr:MAG: hypothetical protein A2X08_08335 [Bacteroidetes bacterium GWA2_32_17]
MKQVTLYIPENKYSFFIELVKSLGFVKKIEDKEQGKEQILKDISEAVEEVKLIKKGQLKGISAKDLLNEL